MLRDELAKLVDDPEAEAVFLNQVIEEGAETDFGQYVLLILDDLLQETVNQIVRDVDVKADEVLRNLASRLRTLQQVKTRCFSPRTPRMTQFTTGRNQENEDE